MVLSAVGDALGWATEFLKPGKKAPFAFPLRDFARWEKFVGGRWWGYKDEIAPGDYSDDTQLTLAVARCIASTGHFQPERFAYSELPLWLHYERGGGRSVKAAARSLIQRKTDWLHNFYKQGALDYRQAGANGAAMRNLPVALASLGNAPQLVRDSFFNAIITHGHPRAILGTILFGFAVQYALTDTYGTPGQMLEYLQDHIEDAGRLVANDERITTWIISWEERGKAPRASFKTLFANIRTETHHYLSAIRAHTEGPLEAYYRFVGALAPETKGSGISTVCAALFLFFRSNYHSHENLYGAVNLLGSDTDTIASFLGALLGARYGKSIIPKHLLEQLQDRDYLLKIASWLYAIIAEESVEIDEEQEPMTKEEAYLRIFTWEIDLHAMFWDELDIGDTLTHPTLGRGHITRKEVRKINREGYIAKLIYVTFDCGQTCVFHSRVEDNERVTESLARDIEKALA
jgi:ADP-ribosylglycohydrolase